LFLSLVKSNPLAELFADEGNLDSNSLKASRIYFARDFDGYIDNLLTPEKRATSPSSSDIINGFSLKDSSANGLDLTLSATKTTLPSASMSVLNSLSCHGLLTNVLERT
jgi:hypothetical protein